MNMSKRKRGFFNYLRKINARKFLRKVSREHIKNENQLIMFSFDFISQSISLDGRYETNELTLVEELFKEKLSDKIAIDIGANIGNHTLVFSSFSKNVYAFEPNPVVFEVLKLNTKNVENIRVYNFGASSEDQTIVAKIPKKNCGAGSVNLDGKVLNSNEFYNFNFNLRKLDSLYELSLIDVGLIKIDVEGHELEAFKGMKKLLKKNKPVILFEQNRGILNGSSPEIDFLRSIGYSQLYEMCKIDEWLIPNYMPKFLSSFFKLFEVLIFGEPSGELRLIPINKLEKKSYDMLVFSFDKIDMS